MENATWLLVVRASLAALTVFGSLFFLQTRLFERNWLHGSTHPMAQRYSAYSLGLFAAAALIGMLVPDSPIEWLLWGIFLLGASAASILSWSVRRKQAKSVNSTGSPEASK